MWICPMIHLKFIGLINIPYTNGIIYKFILWGLKKFFIGRWATLVPNSRGGSAHLHLNLSWMRSSWMTCWSLMQTWTTQKWCGGQIYGEVIQVKLQCYSYKITIMKYASPLVTPSMLWWSFRVSILDTFVNDFKASFILISWGVRVWEFCWCDDLGLVIFLLLFSWWCYLGFGFFLLFMVEILGFYFSSFFLLSERDRWIEFQMKQKWGYIGYPYQQNVT